MAFFTTELDTTDYRSGFAERAMAWLGRALERQNETLSRRAQIDALEAKTDAELAQLGVSRDQIAYYVFRDLFYA